MILGYCSFFLYFLFYFVNNTLIPLKFKIAGRHEKCSNLPEFGFASKIYYINNILRGYISCLDKQEFIIKKDGF